MTAALQSKLIFWGVDIQADFMLPGGALYVPGADKIIPKLKLLTDAARHNEVLLVSSACEHSPNDPEFKTFGPHCVKGTPGARIIQEAMTDNVLTVPNSREFQWPKNLGDYQQILLEKQELDVFSNPQASVLLNHLKDGAQFVVYGVATDYCVGLAAKGLLSRGKTVAIVEDAIAAIDPEAGDALLGNVKEMGGKLINTTEALNLAKG
jgi:nicotinamidase/pyrazinamidase